MVKMLVSSPADPGVGPWTLPPTPETQQNRFDNQPPDLCAEHTIYSHLPVSNFQGWRLPPLLNPLESTPCNTCTANTTKLPFSPKQEFSTKLTHSTHTCAICHSTQKHIQRTGRLSLAANGKIGFLNKYQSQTRTPTGADTWSTRQKPRWPPLSHSSVENATVFSSDFKPSCKNKQNFQEIHW